MKRIKIVTDSTADLDQETIEKYGIEVVPLTISIDGKSYVDGIDLKPEQFMELMKKSAELPKSSQPSSGRFMEVYNSLHEDGFDIISIHVSGDLSGTVQSARLGAEMGKRNVTVVDSKFISKALAFQVVEAAKMAMKQKSVDEILQKINKIKENTRLFVYLDTLENLIKGGRIGKGKGLIGSLLNIKPIASLDGGVYSPVAKVRNESQAIKYFVKQFVDDIKGKDIKNVAIAHADGLEMAEKLKRAIFAKTGFNEIGISCTSPIVSTHTGEGAIGFMYYTE